MHGRSFHGSKKQEQPKSIGASTNPAHLLLDAESALAAQTLVVCDAREALAKARRRRDIARIHVETEQASRHADLTMSVRHRIKFRVRDHEVRVELLMRLYDAHRIATIEYEDAWRVYRDGVEVEGKSKDRGSELKAQIPTDEPKEHQGDENQE